MEEINFNNVISTFNLEEIKRLHTRLFFLVQAIQESTKKDELSTLELNPDFLIVNLVSAANDLTDLFVSLGKENSFLEVITEDLQEKIECYCCIPIPIVLGFPVFKKGSSNLSKYSLTKKDESYLNYLSEEGLFDPKSMLNAIDYLQFKLNNIEIEAEEIGDTVLFICTDDSNDWYKNWLMPKISNLLTLTTQAINRLVLFLEERLNQEQLELEPEIPEIDSESESRFSEPETHSIEFWEYYIIDRIKGSLAHETFIVPNNFTRGEIVKMVKMANKLRMPSMMVELTAKDNEVTTYEPLWVQRLSSSLANLKKMSIIFQIDRLHYRYNEELFSRNNNEK